MYVSLGWYPYAVVQLDIIEIKKMESDLIIVNAETLKNDLNEHGHATVYGIYFDTDKAMLKEPHIAKKNHAFQILNNLNFINNNLVFYI